MYLYMSIRILKSSLYFVSVFFLFIMCTALLCVRPYPHYTFYFFKDTYTYAQLQIKSSQQQQP